HPTHIHSRAGVGAATCPPSEGAGEQDVVGCIVLKIADDRVGQALTIFAPNAPDLAENSTETANHRCAPDHLNAAQLRCEAVQVVTPPPPMTWNGLVTRLVISAV